MNIEGDVCLLPEKKRKPSRQKSVSINQDDLKDPKLIPGRMRIMSTVTLPPPNKSRITSSISGGPLNGIPERERSRSLFEPNKQRQPSDETETESIFFEFMEKTFHPLEKKLPKDKSNTTISRNEYSTHITKLPLPKREYQLSVPVDHHQIGPPKYYHPKLKDVVYMNVDECVYNNRIGRLVSNGKHSLFINTKNTIEITQKNIYQLKIPYGTIIRPPMTSPIQKYFGLS